MSLDKPHIMLADPNYRAWALKKKPIIPAAAPKKKVAKSKPKGRTPKVRGSEMKITIMSAYFEPRWYAYSKDYMTDDRHSLPLTTHSNLTIAALKSMLRGHPHAHWVPEANLMLLPLGSKTPLGIDDDNATLKECGIEDGATLLAFMEGPFTLRIRNMAIHTEYRLEVSSCFQTLGYVRDQIPQLSGFSREEFRLRHDLVYNIHELPDDTPLVDVGLVMPYCDGMPALEEFLSIKRKVPKKKV